MIVKNEYAEWTLKQLFIPVALNPNPTNFLNSWEAPPHPITHVPSLFGCNGYLSRVSCPLDISSNWSALSPQVYNISSEPISQWESGLVQFEPFWIDLAGRLVRPHPSWGRLGPFCWAYARFGALDWAARLGPLQYCYNFIKGWIICVINLYWIHYHRKIDACICLASRWVWDERIWTNIF